MIMECFLVLAVGWVCIPGESSKCKVRQEAGRFARHPDRLKAARRLRGVASPALTRPVRQAESSAWPSSRIAA